MISFSTSEAATFERGKLALRPRRNAVRGRAMRGLDTMAFSRERPLTSAHSRVGAGTTGAGCSGWEVIGGLRGQARVEAVTYRGIGVSPCRGDMLRVPDTQAMSLPRPRYHETAIPKAMLNGPSLQAILYTAGSVLGIRLFGSLGCRHSEALQQRVLTVQEEYLSHLFDEVTQGYMVDGRA